MPTSESRVMAGRRPRTAWMGTRGMAVPLILCFVIFVGIFIGTMVYNRINIKRQTKTTFEYLQAHYMAQSALQHMYLKLRLLPNEAYDTSAVSLGICPFDRSGAVPASASHKSAGPMTILTGDVCTDADPDGATLQGYPLDTNTGGEMAPFDDAGWGYSIVEANAVTAFTSGPQRILVIEVTAEGRSFSYVGNSAGLSQASPRIERIKKTIEIRRQHDDF